MALVIEIPGLAELEARLANAPTTVKGTLEDGIKVATIVMQSLAKTQAPVRTGKLRTAISMETSGLTGTVYPDLIRTPYAMYVIMGTGIFGKNRAPIVPKNGKVLATKVNPGWGTANKSGYFIIGRSSIGQRPNPFMKRAYDLGRVKVLSIMKDSMDTVIKEL